MNRRLGAAGARLAAVLALLAAALGLQVLPAQAAGTTHSWSFTGKCCIYVPGGSGTDNWFRTTAEKNIYFKISSFSPCWKDANYGYTKVTIELWRDDFGPDSKIGNDKVIECTGTAKWSLVDPGKYHFHMIIQYPWRNEHTYTARGAYAYNGATL